MSSLLLRNTRLVPLAQGDHVVDRPLDVLVENGVVTAVGASLVRPGGVDEIDAAGRWLIPGLWDQHVHLGEWTLTAQRLELTLAASPADVLRAVAERVAEQPERPVIGWGHRSGGWGREVTVAELDLVADRTPVVLISGDGHHAWLNSIALGRLGVPARDGVLREDEWFSLHPRLSSLTAGEDRSWRAYRRTLQTAAATGLVGIVDFEVARHTTEWVDRWHAGANQLRIRTASYQETVDAEIERGLRTGDRLIDGDDRLTMGPFKVISDGSLNTRTAWCCQPYADGLNLEHPSGQPNLSGEELRTQLARARAAGLEVAVHAIGDAAVAAALAAYAATGARGSIEHAQLVSRDDVRQIAQLGIRASVQPAHLLDDRDLTEQIWGDRSARSFAFRWMLDEGVELAFGSDAPVSPLDPWLAVAAAVHRGAGESEPWHPEHALSAQEALAASVDGQPMVGVGSRGDLTLLDTDPLAHSVDSAAAAAHLRATHVPLTVVAGRVVHTTL